ncbi:MAG: SAM-dependent methyltransferase, partial [Myxococcota bacterium]
GRVADMGMGSGASSFALASLYPALDVIGVDVNPEMVRRAATRHRLENLSFIEGDIAKRCFEDGSLDAILDSSVLHHVTSFSGYDRAAAARALAVQTRQLADGGVLVVRDFVDPGEGEVWMDLPAADFSGDADGDDPLTCSTAALFERFAREFRLLSEPPETPGFSYSSCADTHAPALREGWRRYACTHRHAVEFVLRKDYRESWAVEVQEEYTYLTQAGFERTFAALGLRVLASTPLRNPWIVTHRFEGRFALWRPTGERLDHPATNYIIVGQKTGVGGGVRIAQGPAAAPLDYLQMSHWCRVSQSADPGRSGVYDLVRRPGPTVDVVPWFEARGAIYVLARRSYPRPIPGCDPEGTPSLDGSTPVTYSSEPLTVTVGDKPIAQTAEELLAAFVGPEPAPRDAAADRVLGVEPGLTYLPSPGGIQEQVRSMLLEIAPVNAQLRRPNTSGFRSGGSLRAIEARQLLRAAQVGGLPDARLEINVYDLLLRRGSSLGAWIGARLEVLETTTTFPQTPLAEILERPRRRCFRQVGTAESPGFLDVRTAEFHEYDAQGERVGARTLEYVVPTTRSFNTVSVACLRRQEGRLFVGVDDDDLPAAQCFSGHSQILVLPAWRLPRSIQGERAALGWVEARLLAEYGVSSEHRAPLGGRYHPSPGVTPEVVFPYAFVVGRQVEAARALRWVPLLDLVQGRGRLREAHLLVSTLRTHHASAGNDP